MKKAILFLLPATAVFAQDGGQPNSGLTQSLLMIAMAAVFFYFILWRPEQKRRKEAEQMRAALKKGDRVTAMGIVGRVDRIQEHTVVLKMIDGSKIEVLKGAITDAQASSEEENKKSDSSSES